MNETSSFTAIAEFYDELMKPVPYRMWVSYYLLLLAAQEVKPHRLLDMCCGTGTMTEYLSREGFLVDGFDLSAPMIEVARRKAKKSKISARFEVADAAEFEMGGPYDAAFSFFDSLNYITDPGRIQRVFEQTYRHLRPGGSLIFDLNTAYAFEQQMFTQKDLARHSKVRYEWKSEWDPGSRICTVDMTFWTKHGEFKEIHRQRAYEPAEIAAMLHAAGFINVRAFHAYTLDPPRAKTDRIHFSAIRPPTEGMG